MRRLEQAAAATLLLLSSVSAFAAAPFVVEQARRSFSVRELRVPRGNKIEFRNSDQFIHQLYVDSAAFKFSSNEQQPGQVVDVAFPVAGTFEVRCEIHPKMVMSVIVE